jgi:hypothetical protein
MNEFGQFTHYYAGPQTFFHFSIVLVADALAHLYDVAIAF